VSAIDDDSSTQPTAPALRLSGESIETVVDGKINQQFLRRGELIGRYTVLGVLGRGGMGVIYRAYDPELNRNVALKLLRVRKATPETAERARARMLREAQALARVSHPNVIAVYDTGTFEGDVFITMELVDGPNLAEWLKKGDPSPENILRVFVSAGRGLAAAHEAGLIHRDFKPSNVMIGKDGRVRVLDFGLAKAADADSEERTLEDEPDSPQPNHPGALDSPLTLQGHIVGTPKYMAPEQLRGRVVDARADQFGFCVALFRALTTEFPFRAADLVELLEAMLAGTVREAPSDHKLPAWLRKVLLRGLSYRPDDRFASMNELLFELGRDRLKRRQLAVYIGLGVMAGAVVLMLVLSKGKKDNSCPAPATYLKDAWGKNVEAAMRAAFKNTNSPHARATSDRVSRSLDKYANRWRIMRHQACVDTRERRARSAKLFDLRVQCLEQRQDQLVALTALFTKGATAELVDRAVSAAGRLSVLDDCEPDKLLARRVKPPEDAQTRGVVQTLRRRLATVRAAHLAGQYPHARELIVKLEAEAGRLGYEPLLAEVLLLQGSLFDDMDDRSGAHKALKRTIELSAKHLDLATEASAWVQLLWVVGYRQGQHKQAGQLTFGAKAAVARAGDPPVLRAALYNNIGSLFYSRADYKSAQESFLEALAMRLAVFGEDDVRTASGLSNLGLVYYRQGDYAKALDYHRRAYKIRAQGLGKTHPNTTSSLNNLGIIAERQGRYADARGHLLKALSARERLLGKNHKKLAGPLNNLGNVYHQEGKYADAIVYFKRSLALKEKAYGSDHVRLSSTLDNLAGSLMKQKKHPEAVKLLQRSLAIETKQLRKDHPDIGYTLTLLGECMRVLGKRGESVALLERSQKILASAKLPGVDLADAQFQLAQSLWPDKSARARARTLAATARAILAKAGTRGQKKLAEVDGWLAGR